MREGKINLDLLDKKILQAQIELKDNPSEDLLLILSERVSCLKYIRSKCTPIDEPFKLVDSIFIQVDGNVSLANQNPSSVLNVDGNVFLSKTCINEWESNTYCPNENKCEMCVIIKQ